MARPNVPLLAFSRGEIGKHALGRIDIDELRLAAQTQINFMPLSVGPMMLRPGTKYLGASASNAQAKVLPFVFGRSDTALLELTNLLLRVWVSDALITNVSVTTTIPNGDFSASAGWTLTATDGATATISGGKLSLDAMALGSSSLCERTITCAAGDQNKVHRLRIVVDRGPVTFQIGSSGGGEQYLRRTDLGTGTHSIAFTPTGDFDIRFSTLTKITKVIDSITVEASGVMSLPAPWLTADLSLIRYDQSGDVVYVMCDGYQPRKIERRDNNSWSVTLYEQRGGPYTARPSWTDNILMEPQQSVGGTRNITTVGGNYFIDNHVNSLIAINTKGNNLAEHIAADSYFTEAIKVSGVNTTDRQFSWVVSGTWTATLTLQRSTEGPDGGFIEIQDETANGTYVIDDSATHTGVDAWYRVGILDGEYTSGVAEISLIYNGGPAGRGEARIIGIDSATSADVEILDFFDHDDPSPDWEVSDFSEDLGWPSSGCFHEGRLFLAGRDKIWGSVSDDYENFDVLFEGEAGPINRSFGFGPFNRVNALMSLSRLIAFRETSETSIRSSNFDSQLTPTDFTAKDCSTQGSYPLAPVKVDTSAIFVEKSGRRVMELQYLVERQDYDVRDLTRFNHDIGGEGFVDIAVQRQPDTRIHFVRGDGQVAILSYDRTEGIEAWWRFRTDGEVETVCVLPGDQEDDVYYVVKRTINGSTVRYLEKWAHQTDCVGGSLNHQADAYLSVSQSASTSISGLSHLEGEEVVVWGNGKDLGNFTVSGGSITGLAETVTTAIVGLEYTADFLSAKLAYGALRGTALFQKKRAIQVGLMLTDTHYQGLQVGQELTAAHLKPLPKVEGGTATAENTVWSEFDAPMIPLKGEWATDARLALRAVAPRPACVVACAVMVDTNEKS